MTAPAVRPHVRCSVCLQTTDAARCACGARMDEARHRELAGVYYLLGQVTRWEHETSLPEQDIVRLRGRYEERRDGIKRDLTQREPESVVVAAAEAVPAPRTRDVRSMVRSLPKRDEEPAREPVATLPPARPIPPPTPPPPPPITLKEVASNLFTERNVRWMLNLGIFIVAVGLIVFVHTQWQSMGGPAKSAMLFGGTAISFVAGHFLRRTTLKITGMALVMLSALGLPIDFAGLAHFKVLPMAPEAVGLLGAAVATAVYVGMSMLYRQATFTTLSWLGGLAVFGYAAKSAGWSYSQVAPLLALPLLGYAIAERFVRDGMWRGPLLWIAHLAGGVVVVLVALLASVGFLSIRSDFIGIQLFLVAMAAACGIGLHRTGRSPYAWGAAVFGALATALALDRGAIAGPLSYALTGAAFQAAWVMDRRERRIAIAPFIAVGAVMMALGAGLWAAKPWSIAQAAGIGAALYLALGLAKRNANLWAVGAVLGAIAAASALVRVPVPMNHWALYAGVYGLPFVAVAIWRGKDEEFRLVSVLTAAAAAGTALILLAMVFMEVRGTDANPKNPVQGMVMALIPAAIFGVLASRERHRFLSDLAWGSVAFAGAFALHATGLKTMWQGVAGALIAPLYLLIDKPVSRIMPRPSLFTGVAVTVSLVIFATVQATIARHYPPSAATFAIVGVFYLALAWRYGFTAHIGVYLLAIAAFILQLELKIPVLDRTAWLMALPVAAIVAGWQVAPKNRDFGLHLGVAGCVVLLSLLSMTFLDPAHYERRGDLQTAIVAGVTAALGGYLAFAKPRHMTALVPAGVMALFAPVGYGLLLHHYSRGSEWGCLVLFALAPVMAGAALWLRPRGHDEQAWPLAIGAVGLAAVSIVVGHDHGPITDAVLIIYALTAALCTTIALAWKRAEFLWAAAIALFVGTMCLVARLEATAYAAVIAFPLAAAALGATPLLLKLGRRYAAPAFGYGILAALALAFAAMMQLRPVEAGGLLILGMVVVVLAAGEFYRHLKLEGAMVAVPDLVGAAMSLCAIVSALPHRPMNIAVVVLAGAAATALSLRRGRVAWMWCAAGLACLAQLLTYDFLRLAESSIAMRALLGMPFLLLLAAFELHRRRGLAYTMAAMVAMTACAGMATVLAGDRAGLTISLFADMLLFGLAAWRFRLPVLAMVAAGAFFGANLSAMWGQPAIHVMIEVTSIAMASVIAARFAGESFQPYARAVSWVAFVAVGGAFCAGLGTFEQVIDPAQINFTIGWLVLSAGLFSGAGLARRQVFFHGIAAANLLAAYYLTLHKFHAGPIEWYTAPLAIGAMVWGAMGLRDKLSRESAVVLEVVCSLALAGPSMVESFAAAPGHTWAAYGAGLLLVVGGMMFKRVPYLMCGTGVFILETAAKAVEFMIRQDLHWAVWMIVVGGVLFAIGAAFESRKVAFVREKIEATRGAAALYFKDWS